MEGLATSIERIRVPGGWIVNQLFDISGTTEPVYQVTSTFVADPNFIWDMNDDSTYIDATEVKKDA